MHINPKMGNKQVYADLNSIETCILHVLYMKANPKHGKTLGYASINSISYLTKFTRNTVNKHIQNMKKSGIFKSYEACSNRVINYELYGDKDMDMLVDVKERIRKPKYNSPRGFAAGCSSHEQVTCSSHEQPSCSSHETLTDLTDLNRYPKNKDIDSTNKEVKVIDIGNNNLPYLKDVDAPEAIATGEFKPKDYVAGSKGLNKGISKLSFDDYKLCIQEWWYTFRKDKAMIVDLASYHSLKHDGTSMEFVDYLGKKVQSYVRFITLEDKPKLRCRNFYGYLTGLIEKEREREADKYGYEVPC